MWSFARFLPAILIISSGCVRIPEDKACSMIEQTPTLDCTIEKALSSGAYVKGEFPPETWWEMFKDEQFNDLICTALSCSPSLDIAESRVVAAEQEAVISRSRLFPTIGFNVGVNWRYLGKNDFFRAYAPTFPASIPEYMIDIDFHHEFDFWGKNRNKYRAALGDVKTELAEYESAKLILTTSVAAVYFKLQALLEKRNVLEKERDNFNKLFGLTSLRENKALDDKQAFLAAQEHLYLINQNITVTDEQINLNQNMLKRLIGYGPNSCLDIHPHYKKPIDEFPLPCHISSDLLSRRPDLMARIWHVEKNAYFVGAAKAEFYPRIDLNALGGLDSVFFSKLFSNQSWNSMIYPALHLPIFTAGRIKANLRARQAEFHQSIYAYNNTLLEAVREVADQIVILQKRDEELEIEKSLIASRFQNEKIVSLRYQNALASLIEVLDAQNIVFEERFKQIGLQYEKQLAAIALVKSLGGGYFCQEVLFD